jgi:uncharacterized paraquat-inducible protein A
MSNTETVTFVCDHCERRIRIPSECAGRRGKCPRCETVIRVPGRKVIRAPQTERYRSNKALHRTRTKARVCPWCAELTAGASAKCNTCGESLKANRPAPEFHSAEGSADVALQIVRGVVFCLPVILITLRALSQGG